MRLKAGGFLGSQDKTFFGKLQADTADLGDAFSYIGSPSDTASKVAFFKSLDVLSVPTAYREPKGLYVLEALANGIPVVQPDHGAFRELIEATGGGVLVEPGDPRALADALEALADDNDRRIELATSGQQRVRELYGPQRMATASLALFEQIAAG
jgi:glycosyltransferase involved in cell wall biosynthesis